MKRRALLIKGIFFTVIVALGLAACGGEKSEDTSIISKAISVPDKKDEALAAASVEEVAESSVSEDISKESVEESIEESTEEPIEESIVESVPESTKAPAEEPQKTFSASEPAKETPTPVVEKEKPVEINEEKETESQAPEVVEQVVQEESIEEDFEIPYNYVDDFSIRSVTDYAHIDTDSVILGSNEKLTIWLTASPSGLNVDDFIFYCEEDELTYTVEDISQNASKNETTIRLNVRSLKEGYHDFDIISTYDLITLGEETPGIWLTIHGLDSRDGQVVYVTPTGEKYHFSADCAGENATATTLYEVESYEYEPCGKCVR